MLPALVLLASVTAQQLPGAWNTDCYRRAGSNRRDLIEFTPDGGVTYQKVYFEDVGCTVPDFAYTITGGWRLGGDVAAAKDTLALDVTIATADITIYDASLMWAFRQERWCGHSYWAINEPLPVLGDICGDEKVPEYFEGQVRPDVVHVDVTSHVPRLYFGDPSGLFTDGAVVAPRAGAIDLDRVFKKDVP